MPRTTRLATIIIPALTSSSTQVNAPSTAISPLDAHKVLSSLFSNLGRSLLSATVTPPTAQATHEPNADAQPAASSELGSDSASIPDLKVLRAPDGAAFWPDETCAPLGPDTTNEDLVRCGRTTSILARLREFVDYDKKGGWHDYEAQDLDALFLELTVHPLTNKIIPKKFCIICREDLADPTKNAWWIQKKVKKPKTEYQNSTLDLERHMGVHLCRNHQPCRCPYPDCTMSGTQVHNLENHVRGKHTGTRLVCDTKYFDQAMGADATCQWSTTDMACLSRHRSNKHPTRAIKRQAPRIEPASYFNGKRKAILLTGSSQASDPSDSEATDASPKKRARIEGPSAPASSSPGSSVAQIDSTDNGTTYSSSSSAPARGRKMESIVCSYTWPPVPMPVDANTTPEPKHSGMLIPSRSEGPQNKDNEFTNSAQAGNTTNINCHLRKVTWDDDYDMLDESD